MVILGHVNGPHGIRGQIKVISYTEKNDGLCNYPIWWLGKQDTPWAALHLESCSNSGKYLIAKLKECSDRSRATELAGQQIAVPRSCLPPLSEDGTDGYYWADLIGSDVINLGGEILGQVIGLLETGANDALQVRLPGSTQVLLIPFVDQFIVDVDMSSRKITVDWGLDY